MNLEALVNTIALAIVAAVCLVQLKRLHRGPDCQTVGIAIVFGGAIGHVGASIASALDWPIELGDFPVDTILYVGLAFVALSATRGALRGFFRPIPATELLAELEHAHELAAALERGRQHERALRAIRDSSYRSALTLRGIANDALESRR